MKKSKIYYKEIKISYKAVCSVLETYLIRNSSKHVCVYAQEKGLQDRGELALVGDWSTMGKRAGHLQTVDRVAKDFNQVGKALFCV